MEIGDWVLNKIEQKGVTKSLIYKSLGMTEAGFRGMIKKNNLSVKNYLQIVNLLSISPDEYFSIDGGKHKSIDINQLREPLVPYRKVKIYDNDVLKTDSIESETVKELLKQNSELIGIIKKLTQ